jgi:hypothetical protein
LSSVARVGAHVEHDRDRPHRVDASCGRVHGELADRDVDAAHAPVADAQDGLRVGGDDEVDIVRPGAEVRKRLSDTRGVLDGQVHAAGALILVAVALDGLPHRRRVDDRQHLAQVQ